MSRILFTSVIFWMLSSVAHAVVAAPRQDMANLPVILGNDVVIGDAKLPWGSQFVFSHHANLIKRQNRCVLNFSYDVTNTTRQIYRIQSTKVMQRDQMLHIGKAFLLPQQGKKTLNGQLYLNSGINQLIFRVETAAGVIEKTAAVVLGNCTST